MTARRNAVKISEDMFRGCSNKEVRFTLRVNEHLLAGGGLYDRRVAMAERARIAKAELARRGLKT